MYRLLKCKNIVLKLPVCYYEIDERDIYTDKQSGKDFNRPEFQVMKRSIHSGDTLFINSLDRFGRNKA